MHTFQPYPADLIEFNPFTKIGNEWMAIVAGDSNKVNTMTASWGGVGVLWGKNVAFIFIRDSRYTKEFLDAKETFSLNFFDPKDKEAKQALKYFGAVSGRKEDKIASVKMHVDYDGDVPYIDESNFVLICKKLSATKITEDSFIDPELMDKWYKDGDMHTMYVGEITQILAR